MKNQKEKEIFETTCLGIPCIVTEEEIRGCKALYEFDALPGIKTHTLMRNIAAMYDTTTEEMKEHWKCIHHKQYCFKEEQS